MRVGEAAAAAGLTADTVRFYERSGVVPPPARAANGYRLYTDRHIESLRFARGLRELDLPLERVAAAVRALHDGTCGDLRRSLETSIESSLVAIDSRIANLQRTRQDLTLLRRGLRKLTPKRNDIPGVTPCGCVLLVGRSTAAL